MSYRILLIPTAEAELTSLPLEARIRMLKQLQRLTERPYPANSRQLTGALRGITRLRVGDYRIAYRVLKDEEKIRVLCIGHRAKFYDDLGRRQSDT